MPTDAPLLYYLTPSNARECCYSINDLRIGYIVRERSLRMCNGRVEAIWEGYETKLLF